MILMLEVAGGVVLGGVILYVLYPFRIAIAAIIIWTVYAAVALGVIGAVVYGGYQAVTRRSPNPTIPEDLFGIAVFAIGYYLVKEAFNGFADTRDIISAMRQEYLGTAGPSPNQAHSRLG